MATKQKQKPSARAVKRHNALMRKWQAGDFDCNYADWVTNEELAELMWSKTKGFVELHEPLDYPESNFDSNCEERLFIGPPERPHKAELTLHIHGDEIASYIQVRNGNTIRGVRRELTKALQTMEQAMAALNEAEAELKAMRQAQPHPVYLVVDPNDENTVRLETTDREEAHAALGRVLFTRGTLRFTDRPIRRQEMQAHRQKAS